MRINQLGNLNLYCLLEDRFTPSSMRGVDQFKELGNEHPMSIIRLYQYAEETQRRLLHVKDFRYYDIDEPFDRYGSKGLFLSVLIQVVQSIEDKVKEFCDINRGYEIVDEGVRESGDTFKGTRREYVIF